MDKFKLIIVEDVPLELKGTEGIIRNEIPEAELTEEEKMLIAQREAIEKLINDKPEEVALLVKTWLAEE